MLDMQLIAIILYILQIRRTKGVSVFPVAFAGGLVFKGPICAENGTATSWHVSQAPDR